MQIVIFAFLSIFACIFYIKSNVCEHLLHSQDSDSFLLFLSFVNFPLISFSVLFRFGLVPMFNKA